MPKPNRLPGHELRYEGRLMTYHGPRNGEGRGRCSCGAESPELKNTARRKQWHRDHKDDLRRGGNGVVWTGSDQGLTVSTRKSTAADG